FEVACRCTRLALDACFWCPGARRRAGLSLSDFSKKSLENNLLRNDFSSGTVSAKFFMPGGSGVDQGCIRTERGMLEPNPVRGSVVLAYCRQTACQEARDIQGWCRGPRCLQRWIPLDVILPRTLVQPLPGAFFRSDAGFRHWMQAADAQCTSATASPWGRNCWDSSSQSLSRFSSRKQWRSR